MTWTGTYDHANSSDTIYAKPRPHSATPSWGDDVVAESANAADGRQRSFTSLVDGVGYSVFKRGAASPASSDVVMASMADVVSAINADPQQQAARIAGGTLGSQAHFRGVSGETYYLKPLPVDADPWWGVESDLVAMAETGATGWFTATVLNTSVPYAVYQQGIGADPASSDPVAGVLQPNASALIGTPVGSDVSADIAALQADATQTRKIAEADVDLVDDGGTRQLKVLERGTSTELIPAKTAKQPDGSNLTDPTTQRLSGYQE